MKINLFPVFTLLFGSAAFAQHTPVSQTPLNKNAVLEELTGINCTYCPDGHKLAGQLAAANPGRVVLVNVHAGGYANTTPDLRTTDGNALNTFFNPAGYPAGAVQRTPFGSEAFMATGRGNWTSQINAVLGQASPVNVAMDASIDAGTRTLTLHVEMYYTTPQAPGTTHYLNIGMVQDNFAGPQVGGATYNPAAILPDGKYNHQHVFRGYINTGGTWGEAIDATQTGVITKTVTYTLPANVGAIPLDIANLKFFAILHEGHNAYNTSKAITAAEVAPEYTNIPASTANLNSITNELNTCNGGTVTPTVKVTNSGEAISSLRFTVSVNGGTPVTVDRTIAIPALGMATVTLDPVVVNAAQTNSIVVNITQVNGGTGNLGSVVTATKPIGIGTEGQSTAIKVQVSTDKYGAETTWKIFNSAGSQVAAGGPYANQTTTGAFPQPDVTLTLPADCYKAIIYDAYGDGFTGTFGNGSFKVLSGTSEVVTISSFTTASAEKAFAVQGALSVDESEIGTVAVYPNPASSLVNVDFVGTGADYEVAIVDLAGRKLNTVNVNSVSGTKTVEMSVEGLASGNYLISITSGDASTTKKLTIQ